MALDIEPSCALSLVLLPKWNKVHAVNVFSFNGL